MNTLDMILIVIFDIAMYGLIGFVWWWQSRKDTTYLLEPTGNGWRRITSIRTSAGEKKVSYNNKSFALTNVGYLDRGKMIRHIDFTTGNSLMWKGEDSKTISPQELDKLVKGHFLSDALRAIKPTTLQGILMILLPIICVVGGIILGYYFGSQQVQRIVENVQTVTRTVLPP